jgi:hypothetical protein
MAWSNLFKSKEDRRRDEARKRRKAFREAENAIDVVADRIRRLKADRDKAWAEARTYLKDGQKAAAQRCLQTCRASEVLMSKLEMKRWVFEQLLSKLELAKSDQDFVGALTAIQTVVQIDPEAVADVLDEVQLKLGEQEGADRVWEKVYGKEMDGVETKMADVVPTTEEMMKQLEDEVVAEHGTSTVEKATETEQAGAKESLDSQIRKGHDTLRRLMEDDK